MRKYCVRRKKIITSSVLLNRFIYRYAPHNDVWVNDGQHTRLWSHKIIILLYYYIIILTIVLQLPTVFSTVTCCTGI